MKKHYNFTAKAILALCFTFAFTYGQAQYCTGVGPTWQWDSNIESLTLVGNSSTLTYAGCSGTSGVTGLEDLTATHSTDIELNTTYSIDVTYGYCGNSAYTSYGKIWIDLNSDGDWDDAGEEIGATSVPNSSQPLSTTYTFTVPATAAIGSTRMRAMQYESGSAGTTTPCASFSYGNVVDFTINIIDCSAGPSYSTIPAQGCGYYAAPSGMLLYETGTFNDTIANYLGCDSVITINFVSNNTYSTINPVVCGTYTSPSGNFSSGISGVFSDTIPNTAGCDSIITINLTNNNSFSAYTAPACNVYTAPSGATYTTSGIYNDTIVNTAGCDSVMTIDVTVNYNDNVTIFATTCGDPYTSDAGIDYPNTGLYIENYQTIHGCDSILYIDVVINSGNNTIVDVTSCDEYISDAGEVYTTTGSFQEMFLASTNCDSTITYNITITSLDLTVSLANSNVLTANESGTGVTYQWVDCNNGNAPIAGETNQTYVALLNGDYACILTSPECSKMTSCFRYEGLSVGDVSNIFNVYPNPSNGIFTIELANVSADASYEVTNTAGQIVSSNTLTSNATNVSLMNVEKGIYIITITNDGSKSRQSIVIE